MKRIHQVQDVEEESNDVNRATPVRGNGSKRSRAAEVHNLSERVSLVAMKVSFFCFKYNIEPF